MVQMFGVVQRRRRLGFSLESAERLRVMRHIIGQEFERDETTEVGVFRPCRPHPSRRRQASRRSGSARWSARSWAEMVGPESGQVNECLEA